MRKTLVMLMLILTVAVAATSATPQLRPQFPELKKNYQSNQIESSPQEKLEVEDVYAAIMSYLIVEGIKGMFNELLTIDSPSIAEEKRQLREIREKTLKILDEERSRQIWRNR